MNKEEIEELKEFTIDLTDIDELALGLEICSKKSNMVIQEFIDTIVQLQQENQSLEKENKILRENAEQNDKVVDKVNWENQKLKKQIDEYKLITIDYQDLEAKNQKLKKQLEEANEKILLLQASEPMLEYKKALEENQQKEFIEYMNKTIEELECDDVGDEELKCCLIQRIDIFKEILLNYKSIMGVSKYKESGE